jgi:hypothetical protein
MRPALFLDVTQLRVVESSWNVIAHGDAREGKWTGNWRIEWLASTLHTISEHGASTIPTANAHTSAASSRLNWCPRLFKWTRPFRRKTKSGFCASAIKFQTQSNFLPTFRDNLSVPSLRVKNSWLLKMGPIGCTETSVINYCYRLRNTPEERRSQVHTISPSASPSTATECLWYWGHPCVEPRLNPLNTEINPVCPLLTLFGAHHIFHVSRLRVKLSAHTPDINASQIRVKSRPFPLVRPSTPCCCQVYCFRPRFAFFPNLPLHWFILNNLFFLAEKLWVLLHSYSIFIEKKKCPYSRRIS